MGRAPPRRCESVAAAFRIRQALHRTRAPAALRIRQGMGELHRTRAPAAFRIRQAKGELHVKFVGRVSRRGRRSAHEPRSWRYRCRYILFVTAIAILHWE